MIDTSMVPGPYGCGPVGGAGAAALQTVMEAVPLASFLPRYRGRPASAIYAATLQVPRVQLNPQPIAAPPALRHHA